MNNKSINTNDVFFFYNVNDECNFNTTLIVIISYMGNYVYASTKSDTKFDLGVNSKIGNAMIKTNISTKKAYMYNELFSQQQIDFYLKNLKK